MDASVLINNSIEETNDELLSDALRSPLQEPYSHYHF